METGAVVENASLFEIDQNRRLYEFYVGWYLKGMSIVVLIEGALAKLAVDSRFHRGMFIAAGAACSLGLFAPVLVGFAYEPRRTAMTFARLAAVTGTDPISTAPFRLVLIMGAVLWLGLAGVWLGLAGVWLGLWFQIL
jgi:hypothetical protein